MKSAVVNVMKCQPNSIIASNRIAKYLAYKLGSPLIDCREACVGEYDRLFIVNGPMLYCNFRPELQALVSRAKDLVWVENDYTIKPPSYIKAREPFIMSNLENYRKAPGYAYVNWNQLTFLPDTPKKGIVHHGLFYYGAYRQGREKYFKKYLTTDEYPTFVSSGPAGLKKFHQLSALPKFISADADVIGILGLFTASLYIEDVHTHKIYNSPANRFYEALSAHTLQLFDKSCLGTFEQAGIDITPWTVDNPVEVRFALLHADKWRAKQLAALRGVDYQKRLSTELAEALKALKN